MSNNIFKDREQNGTVQMMSMMIMINKKQVKNAYLGWSDFSPTNLENLELKLQTIQNLEIKHIFTIYFWNTYQRIIER